MYSYYTIGIRPLSGVGPDPLRRAVDGVGMIATEARSAVSSAERGPVAAQYGCRIDPRQ
jgi:hypothetical protein